MRFGKNYIWSIHFRKPYEESRTIRLLCKLNPLFARFIPGCIEVGYSLEEFP